MGMDREQSRNICGLMTVVAIVRLCRRHLLVAWTGSMAAMPSVVALGRLETWDSSTFYLISSRALGKRQT